MRNIWIVFLFLALPLEAQRLASWSFEGNLNDIEGTYNLTGYNGASYTNAYYKDGSYGGDVRYSNYRLSTTSTIALTSAFTIEGAVRKGTATGTGFCIITNRATHDGTGWSLEWDATNLRLVFQTDNGATEEEAVTANGSVAANTWYHFVVRVYDVATANASIFINGVKSTSDTATLAGYGATAIVSLGCFPNDQQDLYGLVDHINIYNCALTATQIADLYANWETANYEVDCPSEGEPEPPEPEPEPEPEAPVVVNAGVIGMGGILSHNQYMLTYDGADNNDVVGLFDPWYPTDDSTVVAFGYTFVDSEGGIYAIGASTGIVTVLNNASLAAGTDTLIVTTTLSTATENDSIFVRVADEDSCYFIDPAAASGAGTHDSPYKYWSSVTFAPGYCYLQKRGSTNTSRIQVSVNGTSTKPIRLGAYHTGNRPQISCGSSVEGININASYIYVYEYYFYGNLYGIQKEPGPAATVPAINKHCFFSDLSFNSNGYNGALFLKSPGGYMTAFSDAFTYDGVSDVVAYNGSEHGVKIETGHCRVENVRGNNNYSAGVSLPNHASYDTLSGISTYLNGQQGIELSGAYHHLSYSYSREDYKGVNVEDPYSYNSTIINVTVNGTTGRHGIELKGYAERNWPSSSAYLADGNGIQVKNCEIYNCNGTSYGIHVLESMHDAVIQYNRIHDNAYGVVINGSGVDTVSILQNEFHDNTYYDIQHSAGNHVNIKNNLVDGTIYMGAALTVDTIQDNYFKSSTGTYLGRYYLYEAGNLDIDTLSNTALHFTSYAGHDYSLKSTAYSAINKSVGYNYQVTDILGNFQSGSEWDKGPNEYQYPSTTVIPSAAKLKNRIIYLYMR